MDKITNQTNKTAAKTTLSIDLDNFGYFVSGGPSPDFSINGHVVVNGKTYRGGSHGPRPKNSASGTHDYEGRCRVRRPADDHRRAPDAIGPCPWATRWHSWPV